MIIEKKTYWVLTIMLWIIEIIGLMYIIPPLGELLDLFVILAKETPHPSKEFTLIIICFNIWAFCQVIEFGMSLLFKVHEKLKTLKEKVK